MRKKETFFLSIIIFCLVAFHPLEVSAQSGKIPPFRIIQSNGTMYKAENLPFEKPIIITYFSPECDHCQTFMNQLFKRAADVQKASVVWITFLPVEKVSKFVNDYKVKNYSNMVAGTEGSTFFVRNYYKIMDMPFVALYDKNGNLISSWQKNIPLNELLNRLKSLK